MLPEHYHSLMAAGDSLTWIESKIQALIPEHDGIQGLASYVSTLIQNPMPSHELRPWLMDKLETHMYDGK
jgi:hypothetical protein